ncbi:hypothetical protein L915_18723, partial [Phytophthora nicotianae]
HHSRSFDTARCCTPSYTCTPMCEYPDGMVDPYPLFWKKMFEVALRVKVSLVVYSTVKNSLTTSLDNEDTWRHSCVSSQQLATQRRPSEVMKSVMEQESLGSGQTRYAGWYPKLFYAWREDSAKCDVLVTDAHTDNPRLNTEILDACCISELATLLWLSSL